MGWALEPRPGKDKKELKMGKDVHGQIREKTRQDSSEHTGFVYHCDVAALLAASILLCVVAACVDCTPKSAPLVYNGRYIDLASCERKSDRKSVV